MDFAPGTGDGPAAPLAGPAAHAKLLRQAELLLALMAMVIGIGIGILAATTTPPRSGDAPLAGVLAGVGTVLCCWTLLVLAGVLWRRRLATSIGRALGEPHRGGRPDD